MHNLIITTFFLGSTLEEVFSLLDVVAADIRTGTQTETNATPSPSTLKISQLQQLCAPDTALSHINENNYLNTDNVTDVEFVLVIKRFCFDNELKYLLVQCVDQHKAHLAGHGDNDRLFEQFRESFFRFAAPYLWKQMIKPNVKCEINFAD